MVFSRLAKFTRVIKMPWKYKLENKMFIEIEIEIKKGGNEKEGILNQREG